MVAEITVKLMDGQILTITLWDGPERTTVEELKAKIKDLNGVPCDQQRLIFSGEQLKDERTLSSYGITTESTVCQVLILRGGGEVRVPEEDDGMGDKTGKNRMLKAADEHHKRVSVIFVKLLDGQTGTINIHFGPEGTTVEELKAKIKDLNAVPCDQQRLIFNGEQLKDERTLSSYGITNESTVHQVLILRGGGEVRVPEEDDGMGDKTGKNRSMEELCNF